MTLDIVIFGLSLSSSWGNGHATTYRALCKALHRRGHRITFLERDTPWYRNRRDLPDPSYCRLELYTDLKEVSPRYTKLVSKADLVIVGSYVPNGAMLSDWIAMNASGVTAFYDIDTPVTLAMLERGEGDYIASALVPRFDLYLSFTGGPVLELIERVYGSPRARTLHCSVDPEAHKPLGRNPAWSLGYLGTYCEDRDPSLKRFLLDPALRLIDHRFVVAGARYPEKLAWPPNVERIEHVPPDAHAAFYCGQRYTLNVTRADMVAVGFSPSVRLFEAAACGVPIISDRWPGIEDLFKPDDEILIVDRTQQVVDILRNLPEERRLDIAAAARRRVLAGHTAEQRARQLESYYIEARRTPDPTRRAGRRRPMMPQGQTRSPERIDMSDTRRCAPIQAGQEQSC
jgi:spore maturation protein CgeB